MATNTPVHYIAGLVLIGLHFSYGSSDGDCPTLSRTYRMSRYNDKCYQFYYSTKTWKSARDYCWRNGGRLAKVDDAGTQAFLRSELNSMAWGATEMWIGMHDMTEELTWQWVGARDESSEPATYFNWHWEHPEGWFHDYRDCVVMKKDNGAWTWHEATCNTNPWAYRFICEYEPKENSEESGNAGGLFVPSAPTTPRPTTSSTVFTSRTSQILTSDRKRVTLSGNHMKGELGVNAPNVAETKDDNDGNVPLYAVIVSFAAGIIFAVMIILVVLLKRRRRKHQSEAYPAVVYHSQPPGEATGRTVLGAAAAAAPACGLTGKACKMAVSLDSDTCTCGEDHQCRPNRKSNVYVSVDEVTPTDETPHTSTFSSLRDMSLANEEPPTYDEACAGIHQADLARPENVYTSEPENLQRLAAAAPPRATASAHDLSSQGAIPKTTRKPPTDTYLPMDGSSRSQSLSSRSADSLNPYMPMSLGELPPIPTDQGYEIPVSAKLEPEAVKTLHSPITPEEGPCSIYSEIPDRTSRVYKNEEQIYSTID